MNKKIYLLLLIFVFCFNVFADPAEFTFGAPNIKLSLLNQQPDPARAGDIADVRVKVLNDGGSDADKIWVELVPDYPFIPLSGSENSEDTRQIIETLPCCPDGKDYKILNYKVKIDKDVIEGQYPMKFRLSTNTGYSWEINEFQIEVSSFAEMKEIHVDKTKLIPGKETELTFTVNNIGSASLQNLIFSWEEPNEIILPVGSDDTRYIKFLGPGENIPLKYSVVASVNANPDLYALSLNLEFDQTNGSKTSKQTVTTKVGIFVGGETDFDVAFSESTQGQTSLSIANVGSNPALSVNVKIPEQENFRVQGSRNSIVGNLDKGDYTLVSFQISSSNSFGLQRNQETTEEIQQIRQQFGERNNNLKVIIDYTDTTGERQSVEKTVPIQFRTTSFDVTGQEGQSVPAHFENFRRQQSSGVNWTLVFSVLLLIIVILSFVYYKKKREINSLIKKLLK